MKNFGFPAAVILTILLVSAASSDVELRAASYPRGSEIPLRALERDFWMVSGHPYQEESFDGAGKMWMKRNSTDGMPHLHEHLAPPEDDIALLAIKEPDFNFISGDPLQVEVRCANLGTLDQNFTIHLTIAWDGGFFEAYTSAELAALQTGDFLLPEWENGLEPGEGLEICVWIRNIGDEDRSNDGPICVFRAVSRSCIPYVTDDYPEVGNVFYLRDSGYILAKEMRTTDTRPVALVWGGINTVSKGEPYYPWPDPVYDPVEIAIYTDEDDDGIPDGNMPEWADTIAPDDDPWISFSPPYCSHLGQGGAVWVGFRNYLYPAGREALVVDPYPRDHYDTWFYDPNTGSWYSYNGYGDWHIRGCLEYPPPVTLQGLSDLHWTPPYPQQTENPAIFDFTVTLCSAVEGSFSCGPLVRERTDPLDPEWVIVPDKIIFDPPTFTGDAGQTLQARMILLIPCGALEGVYDGTIRIAHPGGIEEIPLRFVIGISSDMDIQDYAGNLSANTMTLMGVRDGIAFGVFKMNNPNVLENNFDLEDGPANSHLYNGAAEATDLTSCGGDPDPKEPIPASEIDFVLGTATLASGQGTYGIVTVNIPFYAKPWHPQYDYAYCGEIMVEYEDRVGTVVADAFDLYLRVLKSSSGLNCGFWGEHEDGANVIHWSDLGIKEDGYALYRDGVRIARLGREYRYIDPVATDAVFDYSLGVIAGGSEIMIGPISVGGHHVPTIFSLSQNQPNPMSGRTSIEYAIGEDTDVSIGVYNSAGMLVETIFEGRRTPGRYTVSWESADLSNGFYFYRLNAGGHSITRKMVVLK
jgi:hypothetical protein